MTSFGCSATDCVYQVMARDTTCRNDVRMAFSQFVIFSAAFDHICDDETALFPELAEQITEERLRRALLAPNSDGKMPSSGSTLVRYVSVLLDDQIALWWRIASMTDGSGARSLPEALTTMFVNLLRAELGSRRDAEDPADGAAGRTAIWRDPLWIACRLVAATPDADPSVDLVEIRQRMQRIGRLFSLIDDVVDLEDDWRTGSSNHLLERALAVGATRPVTASAFEAALSEEISEPSMDEITRLVADLSTPLYRDDLAGWLYSWLET